MFCIVYLGFTPRLAKERVESGEVRFDKIVEMMTAAQYSIHDLSRCIAEKRGEYVRMNMPFEYGVDVGLRRSGPKKLRGKKFLIFERNQYDLKKALSDIAGQDVEYHEGDFAKIIKQIREFLRVEARISAPGPSKIIGEYATFQGWLIAKKLSEGHSEKEALSLPTSERIDEMNAWIAAGRPA